MMRISDELVGTAMIVLVAMKPSLSSRAPVSPNRSLRSAVVDRDFMLVEMCSKSVWNAMAGLVAMKPSLSFRALVSPKQVLRRFGHVQTRGRLVSLVRQSFTMPLELSLWRKVRENLCQKW